MAPRTLVKLASDDADVLCRDCQDSLVNYTCNARSTEPCGRNERRTRKRKAVQDVAPLLFLQPVPDSCQLSSDHIDIVRRRVFLPHGLRERAHKECDQWPQQALHCSWSIDRRSLWHLRKDTRPAHALAAVAQPVRCLRLMRKESCTGRDADTSCFAASQVYTALPTIFEFAPCELQTRCSCQSACIA